MSAFNVQTINDLQNRISNWRGVSSDDAEEIVAESLLAFAIKVSKGVVIEKPECWLLKAAKLIRLQLFDARCRHAFLAVEPAFPDRFDDESAAVLQLRECVAILPEPYRRAVELCDYGNLTTIEAAQAERVPWRTMQSKLRRAYKRLRKMLSVVDGDTFDFRSAG